jgi:hypothetical protein
VRLEHVRVLLAALADGLAMRALGDPSTRALDHDGRRSLLGTAALALIAGCLESTDPRESRSLEQVVRAVLGDLPADADRKPA